MISLIVAVDAEFGIGKNGQIPWHYTEDLKHFSKVTRHGTCIMGRITAEDIIQTHDNAKILPKRESIIVTSNPVYKARDAQIASSVKEAIDKATTENIFIIGGAEIYRDSLPYINQAHITFIPNTHQCDVKIPDVIRYIIDYFECTEDVSTDTGLVFIKAKRKT